MTEENVHSNGNQAKGEDWNNIAAQLGQGNEQAVLLFQQSAAALAAGQTSPLEFWQSYLAGNQASGEDGNAQVQLTDFAAAAAMAAAQQHGVGMGAQGQQPHSSKSGNSKGGTVPTAEKGENVEDLMHKVQKRLQQNRESAKKCRQRKKAYIQQLEEQLAQMRAERDASLQSEVKVTSGHIPGELVANSPAAMVLMPLLQHREQLMSALQLLQHAAENRQDCKPGLNQCLALLKREEALRKQCAVKGLLLVLSGQHLPAEERIVSWMGGIHPSASTRTLVQQLQGRDMLNTEQKEQLERLAGSLAAQEEMVNTGKSQILSSLLMTQDAGQMTPEVLGRMSALKMFLTNAEEIRKNYYTEIEKILTPEQQVLAVLLPYQLITSLQRLIESHGPAGPSKGALQPNQSMPLVFQGLQTVMPGAQGVPQGVPQGMPFPFSSLDPAVAAMALQQVQVHMVDASGHAVVQHGGGQHGLEEGSMGNGVGSKRSGTEPEDGRTSKTAKLEHDTSGQGGDVADRLLEAAATRSQLVPGLAAQGGDGIAGMTLTGQMMVLSPVGMQHALPPGSGAPLQGPIVSELRVEPLTFNGRTDTPTAPVAPDPANV